MKNVFFWAFMVCVVNMGYGQERPNVNEQVDSLGVKKNERTFDPEAVARNKKEKPPITDYKIISHTRDTTFLDTTLTIQKEYKYNYLRKDNFELLPFSNIGQTYNRLGYDFGKTALYPEMGMRSKHYNYKEVEDINYYNVPTPVTDLMFKTTFEQGQLLDALITVNTSPQFNFSIGYKGLRSLGKYQHILTSTGNFVFTSNYKTKNNRYHLRGHIAAQDITNEENGGITNIEAEFESGDEEFLDRSLIAVRYQDAENILIGKRYYIDQDYSLLRKKDSVSRYDLKVGHIFNYETKSYRFEKSSVGTSFGDAYVSSNVADRSKLRAMSNEVYLEYDSKITGALRFKLNHYNFNYLQNTILFLDAQTIPNRLSGDARGVGGEWKHKIGKFQIGADLNTTLSGELKGNYAKAGASYSFNEDSAVDISVTSNSRSPNFNFLMYQSDYEQYNWLNDFKNEETQTANFSFTSKKWFNLDASYSIIDNHAYFGKEQLAADSEAIAQAVPLQYGNTINYLKVKLQNEFRVGKFALNNTVMYQQVTQDDQVLNVPEIVTRNTLYYSNHVFKKAMYLQTGVTFQYFTAYNADEYSPLLGEFYSQNETEIGDFPRLDFFINAKVRQTRIYLKAEHLNSSFTGYNFYSAPNYPYRDFVVRFGVVWNFFS